MTFNIFTFYNLKHSCLSNLDYGDKTIEYKNSKFQDYLDIVSSLSLLFCSLSIFLYVISLCFQILGTSK
ncbi:MAG: hypothetical protein ACK5XN_27695, partial [Bacteroidota bacterium]